MKKSYEDQNYQEKRTKESSHAAHRVLSDMASLLKNQRVLDVGSGIGVWSKKALELGAQDVTAIDGPWIKQDLLEIPPENFLTCNLNTDLPDTLDGQRFRTAIWLENAEHLEEQAATKIVTWLAKSVDHVIFSAAVPGQGGLGHINEQWQHYWVENFSRNGFNAYDPVRAKIWSDDGIPFWYRQNTLLFSSNPNEIEGHLTRNRIETPRDADIIHPELWQRKVLAKKKSRGFRFPFFRNPNRET